MFVLLICLVLYVNRQRIAKLEAQVRAMGQAEAIIARAEGRRHLRPVSGSGVTVPARGGAAKATGGLDERQPADGEPGSPVAVSVLR